MAPMAEERKRLTTRERLRSIDRSLMARLNRVRSRFVFILQATVGAGLSYWVANDIVGHAQPFFAPISTVIILGLSGGDRLKRAVEMAIGGITGVAVGDILFQFVGQGPFQITLIVGATLLLGSFMTKSPLLTNQIVFGSILIATIFPPTEGAGGLNRAIDALIGSAIGVITIALIPNSPLAQARREVSKVLSIAASVLYDVSRGLEKQDVEIIEEARQAVFGTQTNIEKLADAAKQGREASEVSPIMWGSKRNIRSLERILVPVDNGVRGVRVLSRRALVITEDGDSVSPVQIELIEELCSVIEELAEIYGSRRGLNEAQELPHLVQRLRRAGARASVDIVEGRSQLSAYAILAQTRSIVVDLLMICGMSRESAVAVLIPTSQTPAYPPEIYDEDEHDL